MILHRSAYDRRMEEPPPRGERQLVALFGPCRCSFASISRDEAAMIDRLVLPAEEHDDASSYDVEPALLLPKVAPQSHAGCLGWSLGFGRPHGSWWSIIAYHHLHHNFSPPPPPPLFLHFSQLLSSERFLQLQPCRKRSIPWWCLKCCGGDGEGFL